MASQVRALGLPLRRVMGMLVDYFVVFLKLQQQSSIPPKLYGLPKILGT